MSRTTVKLKLEEKSETPIVRVTNLDKRYNEGKKNEVHVLKGISFDIPKGQMVAIMGTSGCGKTTLLNVIGGLDRYSSGSVELAGMAIGDISEKEMTNFRPENIGFLLQRFNHLLTVFTG